MEPRPREWQLTIHSSQPALLGRAGLIQALGRYENSVASLTLLSTSLLIAEAGAVDRLIDGFPDLPRDARNIAERSLAQQQFWGEVNGTGDERDREVACRLTQLECNRIADDLGRIRVKYRQSPKTLKILQEAALE